MTCKDSVLPGLKRELSKSFSLPTVVQEEEEVNYTQVAGTAGIQSLRTRCPWWPARTVKGCQHSLDRTCCGTAGLIDQHQVVATELAEQ